MQKITPFLWYDDKAEDAVNFYASVFRNFKTKKAVRYDAESAKAFGRPEGTVMTIEFEIEGQQFVALNGGPVFKFNPSTSFILNFHPSRGKDERKYLDELWEKLSLNGAVLMPLDKYPFSERYGWLQDKYGVSWQLILSDPDGEVPPFIIPSLLFVGDVCGKAEEASDFYLSIFKNTKRGFIARYPKGMEPDKEGTVMFTDFVIGNQRFAAMDSAREHKFGFNEAISFVVNCDTQEEVDYYWKKLSEGGDAKAQMCGWLKDKYGVSWQIVPTILPGLLAGKDKEKSKRVMGALLQMKKLDIVELEKAYNSN